MRFLKGWQTNEEYNFWMILKGTEKKLLVNSLSFQGKHNATFQRSSEPPGKPLTSHCCWLKGHWQGFGKGVAGARGTLDCLNCPGSPESLHLWNSVERARREKGKRNTPKEKLIHGLVVASKHVDYCFRGPGLLPKAADTASDPTDQI